MNHNTSDRANRLILPPILSRTLLTMAVAGLLALLPSSAQAQSTPASLSLTAGEQYPDPVPVGCTVTNYFTPSFTTPSDTNCEITINSLNWSSNYVADATGTNRLGSSYNLDTTNGGFDWSWSPGVDDISNTTLTVFETADWNVTDCHQNTYDITETAVLSFPINIIGSVSGVGYWQSDICAGQTNALVVQITPPGPTITWAVSNADPGVMISLVADDTGSDTSGYATNMVVAGTNTASGDATIVAYDSAGNDSMGCGVATMLVHVHAAPTISLDSNFVLVNNDDDNGDGTNDLNDPFSGAGSYVTNEDDLVPIVLNPQGLESTQVVTLSVNQGGGGIRIWTNSARGPGVPLIDNSDSSMLSTNWQSSQMPTTLWVEGVSASANEGDVCLTLSAANGCPITASLTVVGVGLKVSQPISPGPTGSSAKYINAPSIGSANNLFSTWIDEQFRVNVNITPESFATNLPTGFIHWSVAGFTVPDNTNEYTFSWSSTGTKQITVEFPSCGNSKDVIVDVPDVGSLSQVEATLLVSAATAGLIYTYGKEVAEPYAQLHFPIVCPERDAVRHSFWNALCVSDILIFKWEILMISTAHEHDNRDIGHQQAFDTTMDLHNNAVGETIAHSSYGSPDTTAILTEIYQKYADGTLWIWAGGGDEKYSEGILIKSDGTKIY